MEPSFEGILTVCSNVLTLLNKMTSMPIYVKLKNLLLQKKENFETVCFEVLRPSQPSGVMSSAVSLLNHTFTGQA